MFGRKAAFGKKKPPIEEPTRRGFGPEDTVFGSSLWEGERGDFLRSAGFAPDDPINRLDLQEPVSVQLARDKAQLNKVVDAGNAVSAHRLGAFLLLPEQLWLGRFGAFLLKRLDLSPYRPWNVIFLPLDEDGAAALNLPVGTKADDASRLLKSETMIEMIAELFAGKSSPEADAIAFMFDAIAGKFPEAFPPEILDLSPNVSQARRRIRAHAFFDPDRAVDHEVIIRSHKMFLSNPEVQLLA